MKKGFLLVAVLFLLSGCQIGPFKFNESENQPSPTMTPVPEVKGVREDLESKTARTVPTDTEQTVLRDVSGGTGSGIATRKFATGRFEHTVLADLPLTESGAFYQGWLVRSQPNQTEFEVIKTGKLSQVKGGWVMDYTNSQNLSDHRGVVVTLETRDDQTPEKHILEGSF